MHDSHSNYITKLDPKTTPYFVKDFMFMGGDENTVRIILDVGAQVFFQRMDNAKMVAFNWTMEHILL
jgi:hypothetical protein